MREEFIHYRGIPEDTPRPPPRPPLRLRLLQPQRYRLRRTTRQSKPTPNQTLQLPRRRFNLVKFLKQPNNNIARLCQSELLSNTNPRATVEREEFPSRCTPRFPVRETFRVELVSVFSPEIFPAMHYVDGIVHGSVGGEEDG